MTASSATSAKAATGRQPLTVRSSASRPSPISAEGFALTGPSALPDPSFHAYRRDLADCALAHQVIASHYAEPLDRSVTRSATLRAAPSDDAEAIGEMRAGDAFSMLDNSLGWAWGYAGSDRRVGYLRSDEVAAA